MKKKENYIPCFSEEIRKLGSWELTLNSQLDILAYILYLNEVKRLQDAGEWFELECTFVLNQTYFSTSQTGEHYYNIAQNILRKKKIECLKKNCTTLTTD